MYLLIKQIQQASASILPDISRIGKRKNINLLSMSENVNSGNIIKMLENLIQHTKFNQGAKKANA